MPDLGQRIWLYGEGLEGAQADLIRRRVGLANDFGSSRFSLETFFSPREAARIVRDAVQKRYESGIYTAAAEVMQVKRIWQKERDSSRHVGKLPPEQFCQMEFSGKLKWDELDGNDQETVKRKLLEQGLRPDLLVDLGGMGPDGVRFIRHSVVRELDFTMRATFSDLKIPRSKAKVGDFARCYNGPVRLRTPQDGKDMAEWLASEPGKSICVPRSSDEYSGLFQADLERKPLSKLVHHRNSRVRNAAWRAVETIHTSLRMRLGKVEQFQTLDGGAETQFVGGRIKLLMLNQGSSKVEPTGMLAILNKVLGLEPHDRRVPSFPLNYGTEIRKSSLNLPDFAIEIGNCSGSAVLGIADSPGAQRSVNLESRKAVKFPSLRHHPSDIGMATSLARKFLEKVSGRVDDVSYAR